jgi:hypothetical protein
MDQGGQAIAQVGEHSLQAVLKEQRFIVADQEVIELRIKLLHTNPDYIQIESDLVDGGHRWNQKSGICGRGFRLSTGQRVRVLVALGDHLVTGGAPRNGWRLFLQCRTAIRRQPVEYFGAGVGLQLGWA